MNIGLIGMGVVGHAFYEGMKDACDILTYDKYKPDVSSILKICHADEAIETMVASLSGPIFISVPTPMNPDGSANTDIVESVCREINDAVYSKIIHGCVNYNNFKKVIVIRSTVPPGTTAKMNEKFNYISVVFNPEFLTEANAVQDFKNQNRIILGGHYEATAEVAKVYKFVFPHIPVYECNSVCAELVKYVGNCFLATKVSFANEIYQICDKLGADYNKVVELASLDARLGKSHWKVPGPDGHFGFGLTCFPKDINALIAVAKEMGVTPTMLEAAWNKNLEVRPEKDWEQLKGRAVL